MSRLKWSALESNPVILTEFLRQLGVSKEWEFVDILSFESTDLDLIPTPVIAVLFLFPLTAQKIHKETNQFDDEGGSVYYMQQCDFNACGTVAAIHAVANNLSHINLSKQSPLYAFIEKTKHLSAKDKADQLAVDIGINTAHEATAWGSTIPRPEWLDQPECQHHYITFVQVDSKLYELDGKRSFPFYHGITSDKSFLKDAAKLCKEYFQYDQNNIQFNAMALHKI